MNRELIGRVEAVDSPQRVVLDVDSTEIPVYRQQENSAYNGHFESNESLERDIADHRFRSNEVRLWLSVTACNLGTLWRQLVVRQRLEKRSLTSLQQRLVKTGGRSTKHARYYWLLLAERHLTRRLFGALVRRIEAPPMAAG